MLLMITPLPLTLSSPLVVSVSQTGNIAPDTPVTALPIQLNVSRFAGSLSRYPKSTDQ